MIIQKQVRHKFSEDEIRILGEEMAEAVSKLGNLEEELQEVLAGFKEKIAGKQRTVKSYAEKIRSGFEFRTVDCRIEKDFRTNTDTDCSDRY